MQHDNFDEEDSLRRIEQGDEVAARMAQGECLNLAILTTGGGNYL